MSGGPSQLHGIQFVNVNTRLSEVAESLNVLVLRNGDLEFFEVGIKRFLVFHLLNFTHSHQHDGKNGRNDYQATNNVFCNGFNLRIGLVDDYVPTLGHWLRLWLSSSSVLNLLDRQLKITSFLRIVHPNVGLGGGWS